MIERLLKIIDIQEDSVFLFGARQTGKTTLLLQLFPNSRFYDLLETDVYERMKRNPSLLRQELSLAKEGDIVIIDEIQLIPELLNEVHWLITRQGLHFILSGSSARKLKRRGVNTLGGRAVRNVLYPLVSAEIPDFDIMKAVNRGTLPTLYLATSERQQPAAAPARKGNYFVQHNLAPSVAEYEAQEAEEDVDEEELAKMQEEMRRWSSGE